MNADHWDATFAGMDLTQDVRRTIQATVRFQEVLAARQAPGTSYVPRRAKGGR